MGPSQDQNQPNQIQANKPKPKTKTFVGLIILVLIVVGVSAFAWTKIDNEPTKTQDSATEEKAEVSADATMAVEVKKEAVKVGETVDFAIYVDSGDTEVNAVGVEATYSSDNFELVDVSYEGTTFDIQAEEITENGKISLERGAGKPVSGRVLVATIKLKPTQPSTDSGITLKDKSQLLAVVNAQNILNERTSAKVQVTEE